MSSAQPRQPSLAKALLLLAAAAVPAWVLARHAGDGEREVAQAPAPTQGVLHEPPAVALVAPRSTVPVDAPLQTARAPEVALQSSPAPAPDDPLSKLLHSEDLRERYEGLRLLAATDPARAAPEILAYIEDTREAERALLQRLAAVKLLGDLEGVALGYELTQLYERDEPGVRRAAALALAEHGDDSLIERELAQLGPDLAAADGGVRARAAASVSALSNPRALPVLIELLDDPNSDVRAHAVDGLWRTGDVLALPDAERLLTDPVARVRERAQRAVNALRGLQAGGGGALAR